MLLGKHGKTTDSTACRLSQGKQNKVRFAKKVRFKQIVVFVCLHCVCIYSLYIYIFLFEFGTITLKDYILDMVFQHIAQSSPVADEP